MPLPKSARTLLLLCLASAAAPWQALAVYDTKTGTNSESTSERMSREAQETKVGS